MAQSSSNNGGANTGGWFKNGFSRLSNIFGGGASQTPQSQQRKRTLADTLGESPAESTSSPRALSLSGGVKRIRRNNDPISSDFLSNTSRLNTCVRDTFHDPITQSSLNNTNRSLIDFPAGRRAILDFQNTSITLSQKKPTRAKQILDILDKIETSTTPVTNDSFNFSKTQKWLEDINVIKATPPPRKSLRTPSRLSSIIANSRPKPSWQHAQSNQPPAPKPKETSFEEQEDPGDVSPGPVPTLSKSTFTKPTPYTINSQVEKRIESRSIKSSSGKNVLRATDDVFEIDTDDTSTMEQFLSIKPPFSAPPSSAYRLKPRSFKFTLPVLRGPQVVIESVIEELTSADSAVNSDDDALSEESPVSTPVKNNDETKSGFTKFNFDTSSSIGSGVGHTQLKSAETPETPQLKSWICNECFVDNEATDTTCTCCGSSNTGADSKEASTAPAFKAQDFTKKAPDSGGFKFGLSTFTVPATSVSLVNVTEPTSNSSSLTKTAASFTFGVKPTESNPVSTSALAAKPLFGLPITTTASNSAIESTPTSSSLFTTNSTLSNAPLFGTSATTASNSQSALFGAPVTSESTKGLSISTLFSSAPTSTTASLLFASTPANTTTPLFGTPTPAPSTSITATLASTGFPAPPAATIAGTLFGTTVSTSASDPSIFGASLSSSQLSFCASQPLFEDSTPAVPASNLFGASTTPASEASKTNDFNFGAPAPVFGTLNSASSSSNLFGNFGNTNVVSNDNAPPKKRSNTFGSQPSSNIAMPQPSGFSSNTTTGFSFGNPDSVIPPTSFTFGSPQPTQNGGAFQFSAPAASQTQLQFGAGGSQVVQFSAGGSQLNTGGASPFRVLQNPAANAFVPPPTSGRKILKPYRRR